jgi:hypothetical protein
MPVKRQRPRLVKNKPSKNDRIQQAIISVIKGKTLTLSHIVNRVAVLLNKNDLPARQAIVTVVLDLATSKILTRTKRHMTYDDGSSFNHTYYSMPIKQNEVTIIEEE